MKPWTDIYSSLTTLVADGNLPIHYADNILIVFSIKG